MSKGISYAVEGPYSLNSSRAVEWILRVLQKEGRAT